MPAQLVFQFPEWAIDLDGLQVVEEASEERLSEPDYVDGHDIGSGEANVFLIFRDPVAVFEQARVAIPDALRRVLKAGFRPAGATEYRSLWPPGESHFSVK